jgi:hypothetical protein
VGESTWRCSACGTINSGRTDACGACGRWPSLFDLDDSVDSNGQETPEIEVSTSGRSGRKGWLRLLVSALWPIILVAYLAVRLLLPDGPSDVEPVTRERMRATAGETSQPFAGSPACDVYVVPLDRPSKRSVRRLASSIAQRHELRVCRPPSLYLDVRNIDDQRPQLDAHLVFSQLAQAFRTVWPQRTSTVLAVTELDLFSSSRPDWRFVFGLAGTVEIPQSYGIISTARMGSGDERVRRLETMATRYLGFYYFGLPASSDPTSALYPTILGLGDLDRLRPSFGDPPPTDAELRAARAELLRSGGREPQT